MRSRADEPRTSRRTSRRIRAASRFFFARLRVPPPRAARRPRARPGPGQPRRLRRSRARATRRRPETRRPRPRTRGRVKGRRGRSPRPSPHRPRPNRTSRPPTSSRPPFRHTRNTATVRRVDTADRSRSLRGPNRARLARAAIRPRVLRAPRSGSTVRERPRRRFSPFSEIGGLSRKLGNGTTAHRALVQQCSAQDLQSQKSFSDRAHSSVR